MLLLSWQRLLITLSSHTLTSPVAHTPAQLACSNYIFTALMQVAAELRAGVEAATRLTCSVGIAPNATLAKVASDLNKPNGQALVVSSREAVMAFVHDLPIRKVIAVCMW